MKKRWFVVSTLCVVLIVLYVALRNREQDAWRDRSILAGVPCEPPCWQGIVPGMTSKAEALEILENSPYVEKGSIQVAGTTERGGCLWEYRTHGKRIQPGVSWKNGVVDEITLGLNFDITVQEILDRYGTPEGILGVPGGIPEHWYWIIIFYYPSQGVEFQAFTLEFDNNLQPTTAVETATLYRAQSMDEKMNEDVEEGTYMPIKPWAGYGDVTELYKWESDY